ncbi:MAG: SRPBCC family protein [Candidatus Obscuribacterales bacterium]|nr:SRPBCC family protein [Cyanobacteria bacterium SZAS LIN-5]RTL40392.1 MAG: hypothetical protein EKK48_16730 [Candidatus Melainabacteria bacterium]
MRKTVALAALALLSTTPALAQENLVSGSISINAPARVVWEAVHTERQNDPDLEYSKVLEQHGNQTLIEQKFNALPVVGAAVCQLIQREVPNERIDYKLVKSDKFKALNGSWVLTSSPDGRSTTLELSSHLDTGLAYSQGVIDLLTKKKIDKRLENVKRAAEAVAVIP